MPWRLPRPAGTAVTGTALDGPAPDRTSTARAETYAARTYQGPGSRYSGGVLRTRPWRSASLRLLTDHDRDEALALCDRDPIANIFVSSRIRAAGIDPSRLGGQLWGYSDGGQLTALCYS